MLRGLQDRIGRLTPGGMAILACSITYGSGLVHGLALNVVQMSSGSWIALASSGLITGTSIVWGISNIRSARRWRRRRLTHVISSSAVPGSPTKTTEANG